MTLYKNYIFAGIALLAFASPQSLRADLRRELSEKFSTTSLEAVRPLIEESKQAGLPEGYYFSGRLAMLGYDFDQASKDFAEYARLSKAKKVNEYADQVAEALSGVKEGKTQFERMQDIVVIDAVNVDKDSFLKHLRLPQSAGRVVSATEIPGDASNRGSGGYISESGDLMLWSEWGKAKPESTDNAGEEEIDIFKEASRLTDGSLSEAQVEGNFGESPDYPFLTSDGMTLYFSAYGNNSVGGRDIFIASRDPQTGNFRQPVNAGFPFNSSADDYLLAVDEENGVGWCATDRHLLDGQVTLYVFMLPEGRKNFEGPEEEKRARGVLNDIRITWNNSASSLSEGGEEAENEVAKSPEELAKEQAARENEYKEKAAEIRKIVPGQKPRRNLCRIPIKGGGYIYSPDDVKTPTQRRLVEEYIRAEKEYTVLKTNLDKKRRLYATSPSDNLGVRISGMEKEEAARKMELTRILSALYKEM